MDVVVFSRTLPASARAGIRVVNDDPREVLAALKKESGRDIWLFGGGSLFRSLLDAQLVDTVKVTVIPVFLGTGVPLLPPGSSTKLILAEHEILRATGIVVLSYSLPGSVGPAPRVGYIKDQKDPSLVGKPSRIPASHPPASRARTRALRSAAKKRNCLNEG
jgi:hypothetical protein